MQPSNSITESVKLAQKAKLSFLLLMSGITTLVLLATDIYAPAMPAVSQYFAVTPDAVQLTITLFLMSFALSQLIYGPLSDHLGRRPILLIGLGIFILGTVFCVFAHQISVLYLGRFIQGIGAGAAASLNRVIVRDSFTGIQLIKMMSYMAMIISITPAVAPAIGGFIQLHAGWRCIFIVLLLYGVVIMTWAYAKLPETNRHIRQHAFTWINILRSYLSVIRSRDFWAHAICTGVAFSAIIVYSTMNPYLMQDRLGLTPAEYGLWVMLAAAGLWVGMLLNARLVDHIGSERMLLLGLILMAMMGVVLVITGGLQWVNIPIIVIPTFIISCGAAFVLPNAAVGALAPFGKNAGVAGAVYGSMQVIIGFIASLIVMVLSEHSQLPMGCLIIGLGLIGYVSHRLLAMRNQ